MDNHTIMCEHRPIYERVIYSILMLDPKIEFWFSWRDTSRIWRFYLVASSTPPSALFRCPSGPTLRPGPKSDGHSGEITRSVQIQILNFFLKAPKSDTTSTDPMKNPQDQQIHTDQQYIARPGCLLITDYSTCNEVRPTDVTDLSSIGWIGWSIYIYIIDNCIYNVHTYI